MGTLLALLFWVLLAAAVAVLVICPDVRPGGD